MYVLDVVTPVVSRCDTPHKFSSKKDSIEDGSNHLEYKVGIFSIAAGKTCTSSPAFINFKTGFKNIPYPSIDLIIKKLERLCKRYHIHWAEVDGNKILEFLENPLIERVKKEDLLNFIHNRKEVRR